MSLKKFIQASLRGANHYACFLPEKTGLISFFVLKKFFFGIKFDKSQQDIIQNIPDNAIIVYATKYKSTFEYLFSHTRYKETGLRFPQICLGNRVFAWQPVTRLFKIILAHIGHLYCKLSLSDPFTSGFVKQELLKGTSATFYLVEKKGFYKRFVRAKTDPIHYFIELQSKIEKPIYIVPQVMFFSKISPRYTPNLFDFLFGSEENPGTIRSFYTLFKNPGRVFVEISKPVNLKNYLALPENQDQTVNQLSIDLRRHILNRINRHRHSITGPIRKTRYELKENILTNSRMQELMKNYAAKHNLKNWEVHKKADDYIDEIAARYSLAAMKIVSTLVKWMLKGMFDGLVVNYDMLAKIKEQAKSGPLILVPCHKSHVDYLILANLLLRNDVPPPHVAAGQNLSFWPLGPIFRSVGAFFIRRSFQGAILYSKIFTEYIYKLLEEGCNIEFFIEGGRSRTGKLLRPQLGLFSIIINAYKNGACDDLNIVPVFVGYDRVIEENAYLHEINGGKKEPESLTQVIEARKFLKKIYGKIYINFAEPISLKEFTNQNKTSIKDMTNKNVNGLCRNIGNRILNSIDKMTVIPPHALVASAVLNCSERMFSYERIMSHIETYMNFLFLQQAKLSDTLILDRVNAIENALDSYIQRKFIDCISKDKNNRFKDAKLKVNENKRPALDYYKNNCISFFIPAAFTALAILEKDAFQFSAADIHARYGALQFFFINEFYHDLDKTPEYFVRKNLKAFIDDAILMPHPTLADTYNITSAGFRKLKLFSKFLQAYFESYLVVINFFASAPKSTLTAKSRMKKVQSLGQKMYKNKEIELKEALSKVNYQNGIDFFNARGIRGADKQKIIESYSDTIQKSLNSLA